MAYVTDYVYSVDRKTASLEFHEDATPLCTYSLAANVVTVSARVPVVVVSPTWGTNKDIAGWFSLITSMSGRFELVEGSIRGGYGYEMKVDAIGVEGEIEIYGENLGGWTWVSATDTLNIGARVEHGINWAELRSYIQWMQHFQYAVQNYGGG